VVEDGKKTEGSMNNRRQGFFRLLEAVVDGIDVANRAKRKRRPAPAGPMRGQRQAPPAQRADTGCGGCTKGRK